MQKNFNLIKMLISEDKEFFLENVFSSDLKSQNLITIIESTDTGVKVKANNNYYVGNLCVKNYKILILPDFSSNILMKLYFYSSGLDYFKKNNNHYSFGGLKDGDSDSFLELLANLYNDYVAKLLNSNLAKKYVSKTEKLKIIKGRPIWEKNFGSHPVEGITCRYFDLSFENKINAAIYFGLQLVSNILLGTTSRNITSELLYKWGALGNFGNPSSMVVNQALSQLNRLSEHYRPALLLIKFMLDGYKIDSFSDSADIESPYVEFYLPHIFEKFLYRLIGDFLKKSSLNVVEQKYDDVLIDGDGDNYKRIIPDLLVYSNEKVVGLIDAKFKTRYCGYINNIKKKDDYKVSSADIYQLFFYQSNLRLKQLEEISNRKNISVPYQLFFYQRHLKLKNRKADFPKTIIAVPYFSKFGKILDQSKRTIYWNSGGSKFKITVIPIPIEEILYALEESEGDINLAFSQASELRTYIWELIYPKYTALKHNLV